MQLQSVKQTAERFNVSERRVQKLCEEGRIDGAQMISNVWVIPSNALKPADERTVFSDSDFMSLSDLCKELSVSIATGRNWLRLGKIIPSYEIKKTPFFDRKYVSTIKNDIKTGKKSALKSRRNKKYVSGNNIYNSYVSETSKNLSVVQTIIDEAERINISLTDETLRLVIAECAVQLILSKNGHFEKNNCLLKYLHGELPMYDCWYLVDDLINDNNNANDVIDEYPEMFAHTYVYEPSEDVLGLLYISLKNIGERKATGSYYTPTKVVKNLCDKLFYMNDPVSKKVLDPCCGTGNFILQLPSEIGYENVFGNDIDTISVQIARINYALKYGVDDPETVYNHITEYDYLSFDDSRTYDFIIGNPPWGYSFSDEQKNELRKKYLSASGSSIESYDVFVEQALANLNENGLLSFVLPEAILNVKTHAPIRDVILKVCSFQYLEFLGNAFDKVQCPCIILQMMYKNTAFCSEGLTVKDAKREFTISTNRKVSAECISFSMTDEEYQIIQKMERLENKTTLQGKSRFALGIVTGNNKEYIYTEKRPENEMILKGSDLCKYKFTPSTNYIVFSPETFQQVAPTELYRAPEKLLYRFICNQLVFAYDDKQTLSLNSCNILIPEIPDLDIKYIMAVLNSRCIQFYFKKQFNSVKVLRAHIEALPIPVIPMLTQKDITSIVDNILGSNDSEETQRLYDELDVQITMLFDITSEEYAIIKASMAGENLFLA